MSCSCSCSRIRSLIEWGLALPRAAQLLFAANVATLAFALTMQFGFGIYPCVLCLMQRGPYAVAAILALAAWLWRPYGSRSAYLLYMCAAVYAVGFGLGVFHSGVELHWWLGTSGCAIKPLNAASAETLRQSLLSTTLPPCDVIPWTLFGLSMANWNIPASLALTGFSALAGRRAQSKR